MATLITLYEYGYAYAHFYYFFLSQYGKSTLILRYMSMATPRLCSSLLCYWLLYGYGNSTLVFRFLSMAIPSLISMLILYGYGKSTLIVSLWVWRCLRSSLLYYYKGTESPRSLLVGFLQLWLRVLNSKTLLTASVILSFFPLGTTPYLNKCFRPALLMSLDIPIRVGNYIQPAGALVYDVTA